ncbi:hypothetical protein ABT186_22105 [Streptomyces sp. NPDC001634]|uniref:hypothetical protein n=1 Tax=Streptomyces sp. NPDC001634 TaxID=3154390 RepID=UPI0033309FC0
MGPLTRGARQQQTAGIADLAHGSDPLRIVRVAIAGAYVDRVGGCAEGLRRVVAGGRRGESITPAIDALFLLGNHAWLTGQWPDLGQAAREGRDLCDRYNYPMLARPGKFLLACTAAACGSLGTHRPDPTNTHHGLLLVDNEDLVRRTRRGRRRAFHRHGRGHRVGATEPAEILVREMHATVAV